MDILSNICFLKWKSESKSHFLYGIIYLIYLAHLWYFMGEQKFDTVNLSSLYWDIKASKVCLVGLLPSVEQLTEPSLGSRHSKKHPLLESQEVSKSLDFLNRLMNTFLALFQKVLTSENFLWLFKVKILMVLIIRPKILLSNQ